MDLATSLALLPLCCLVACSLVTPSVADPAASAPAPLTPPAAAAPAAPTTERSPAALAGLLARYDAAHAEVTRAALATEIDRVAGQRFATVARLYWHTDLAAAQAEARASGKPILSLRLLGRLDEDLSCANSRMFRTILYPDAAVGQLLRDRFVLHWSSERPVPTVTIDYGDGRTLATTVTGNSAHYVLDADGHVLDVLPGLYAPSVFRAELARAADLAARIRATPAALTAELVAYHRGVEARLIDRWRAIRALTIVGDDPRAPTQAAVDSALAAAQRATVSKAYVEVPLLRRLDLGADPGQLPTDLDVQVITAARLFGFEVGGLLDAAARGVIVSLLSADAAPRARALMTLERTIAADTLVNDVVLRRAIRRHLLAELDAGTVPGFAATNAWIYADVFQTPASDPWLGLRPADTFTGLAGGAILAQP